MVLMCTSPIQESISNTALLYDFETSLCTLPLLEFLKCLTETPCMYAFKMNLMFLKYKRLSFNLKMHIYNQLFD